MTSIKTSHKILNKIWKINEVEKFTYVGEIIQKNEENKISASIVELAFQLTNDIYNKKKTANFYEKKKYTLQYSYQTEMPTCSGMFIVTMKG